MGEWYYDEISGQWTILPSTGGGASGDPNDFGNDNAADAPRTSSQVVTDHDGSQYRITFDANGREINRVQLRGPEPPRTTGGGGGAAPNPFAGYSQNTITYPDGSMWRLTFDQGGNIVNRQQIFGMEGPAPQQWNTWRDPNTGIVYETDATGRPTVPISSPVQQPGQGDYKDFTNGSTGEVTRVFFDAAGKPTGESVVLMPGRATSAQNTGGQNFVNPQFQQYAMEQQLAAQLAGQQTEDEYRERQLAIQEQQQRISLMNARQNAARNYADVISTVDPAAYNAFVQAAGGNIANALYMDPDGALSDRALQPGVEALSAIRDLDRELAGGGGGGGGGSRGGGYRMPSFAEWQANQRPATGAAVAGGNAQSMPNVDYRIGYGATQLDPSQAGPVAAPMQTQGVVPNVASDTPVPQPSGFALDQVQRGLTPQSITWAGPTSLRDVDPSVYVLNPQGGAPMRGGSGDMMLPGTSQVIRMAGGGYTTAPMMMTGDAAHPNPEAGGAQPEIIINPMRAPLAIVPNPDNVVPMPRFAGGTLSGLAPKNIYSGMFRRPRPQTTGTPDPVPTPGGSGGSIIDQVRDTRTNVQFPQLNTYNVGYELMDPTTRAAYEAGMQTKFNIPKESLQFEWMKYRQPGAGRGQVALGY